MLNTKTTAVKWLGLAGLLAFGALNATPTQAAGVAWKTSMKSGLAEAKKSGKPIFVYTWATWCGPCKLVSRNIFPKAKFISESKKWVMVKLEYKKTDQITLPEFTILKSNGKLVKKTTKASDFKSESALIALMKNNYSSARK